MSFLGGITQTGAPNTDASSQSAQAQDRLEEDLNQFLTLLTTQLQNQDPLDPLDSNEFTSQLVQFAEVEQQIFQNSNLETLIDLQEGTQISNLVNFINNTVEYTGQDVNVENSEGRITYNIPNGAVSTTISVINEAGVQVFTTDGETQPGVHAFIWDGQNAQGIQQPDGLYRFQVNSQGVNGELLDVFQTAFGRVTGAGVVDGETTLFLGTVRTPQSDILVG